MIEEKNYWKIIDNSLVNPLISVSEQMEIIELELFKKSVNELVGFHYWNRELYRKAYTSRLWAAAYIARGGCSDDSFHYFRCWLVTRDSNVYKNALENPDNLISEFSKYEYRDDIQYEFLNEHIEYAYRRIAQDNLPFDEMVENEYEMEFDNKGEEEMSQIIEFDWDENDEDSLRRICPRLYERYWNSPLKFKKI